MDANNSSIDDLPERPSQAALDLASSIWGLICDAHPEITCENALEIIANIGGMIVSSVIGPEFRRLAADDFRQRVDEIMIQAIEAGDKTEAIVN